MIYIFQFFFRSQLNLLILDPLICQNQPFGPGLTIFIFTGNSTLFFNHYISIFFRHFGQKDLGPLTSFSAFMSCAPLREFTCFNCNIIMISSKCHHMHLSNLDTTSFTIKSSEHTWFSLTTKPHYLSWDHWCTIIPYNCSIKH